MNVLGQEEFTGKQGLKSFTFVRLFKFTAPTHALYGGSLFLGYQLVFEFLRHHDELNQRPLFIDHTFAMTLIGGIGAACIAGSPRHVAAGAIFSALTLGPMVWWLKLQGNRPG